MDHAIAVQVVHGTGQVNGTVQDCRVIHACMHEVWQVDCLWRLVGCDADQDAVQGRENRNKAAVSLEAAANLAGIT